MDIRSFVVLEERVKLEQGELVYKLHLPIGSTWDQARQSLEVYKEAINQLEKASMEQAKKNEEKAQEVNAELVTKGEGNGTD